jgi:hypothetical protein
MKATVPSTAKAAVEGSGTAADDAAATSLVTGQSVFQSVLGP